MVSLEHENVWATLSHGRGQRVQGVCCVMVWRADREKARKSVFLFVFLQNETFLWKIVNHDCDFPSQRLLHFMNHVVRYPCLFKSHSEAAKPLSTGMVGLSITSIHINIHNVNYVANCQRLYEYTVFTCHWIKVLVFIPQMFNWPDPITCSCVWRLLMWLKSEKTQE